MLSLPLFVLPLGSVKTPTIVTGESNAYAKTRLGLSGLFALVYGVESDSRFASSMPFERKVWNADTCTRLVRFARQEILGKENRRDGES